MKLNKVLVWGNGTIGLTTAKLCLDKQNCEVTIIKDDLQTKPIILLNEDTKFILSSIWQMDYNFLNGFQIVSEKRNFINSTFNSIPFNETVINPSELNKNLTIELVSKYSDKLTFLSKEDFVSNNIYDWEFHSSASFSNHHNDKIKFGKRNIYSISIDLPNDTLGNTCSLLSTSDNWIFIFPYSDRRIVIQIMCLEFNNSIIESIEALIKNSISQSIELPRSVDAFKKFDAFPWIKNVFFNGNQIFIGSAVVSYDPICGDGLGNNLRSSLLATAIILSDESYETKKDMLVYYKQRLTLNFTSHIKSCLNLYSAKQGWDTEIDLMKTELHYLLSNPTKTKTEYFLQYMTLTRKFSQKKIHS